jgi:hypothetical protein
VNFIRAEEGIPATDYNKGGNMTKMERLKREARETATRLGHRLGRFSPSVITDEGIKPSERAAAVAACELCGVIVVVDPAPALGEEAVRGEGVLRPCAAIEQEGHETA